MAEHVPGPHHRTTRVSGARLLALIAAIGPIAFIALTIVLGVSWEGYDPVRDTQSELGAVNAPHGTVMNVAGFMGLGLCILAFAGAYGLVLRGRWARWLGLLLIVAAGTGMVVVGFFPCDADCVDVTVTGRLHGVFSAPGAIGLPLAAIVSSLVFRLDGRFGTGWQLVSFWGGLLALASGPVIQAELFSEWNGLVQRLAMWPALLWVSAVSVRLHTLASAADGTG
ncbi:MAG: DUF998 domain-containing protein [Acidimicrobiales bacterium]|nr:DUF998 domain-containing protein [Acidimicrobiales bacterium]